jgi:hypothetical protein
MYWWTPQQRPKEEVEEEKRRIEFFQKYMRENLSDFTRYWDQGYGKHFGRFSSIEINLTSEYIEVELKSYINQVLDQETLRYENINKLPEIVKKFTNVLKKQKIDDL